VSANWPAPAKLNLFLQVVGRRADGYHELQTLFQLVELADELSFSATENGQIRRLAGAAAVPADQDLVVRAARVLRAFAGRPELGVDIRVTKRIPIGGGLGGGSSDAATTLVALNCLWRLNLDLTQLASLGVRLGADVPLFIHGRSAWAEGVGERLTPVTLKDAWYAIVYPGAPASTAEAFQAPELTRNSPVVTLRDFLAGQDGTRLGNALEPVVAARHEGVRRALSWLKARGEAHLTGSGSCVFCAFPARAAAEAALVGLPASWSGVVARGIDTSPLVARRAAES
jgi:4-diphosphocytidyl-2-C-methyl-D-erythritol kinase